MKERNSFGDTEATHALAVHHQAIITLVVILLLLAGREFRGATRLAGHLLQDNDQAVGAELESNDLTSVTTHAKESTPTPVPAASKMITVTSDMTDERGIRHVVILTTATGNNREGYEAAERQAHEWFFHNQNFGAHDSRLPYSKGQRTAFAEAMVQAAISDGYLDPGWLDRTHPRIRSDDRLSIFGSHRGINPTAREPTWGFQFEIVPMEAWN